MPFDNDQDIDQMLAPYRSAVQKLQQPYPMLGRLGGSLGQNHPLLAGALNQGLEAAAFTPGPSGPEGVGGGISRALQGVLGASQFDRQRMMQTAMLPYQMLQPRLQAEDTLAQIKDRESLPAYRKAMEDRADAQTDYYNKRAGALDNVKALTGEKRTDDEGNPWHGVFDPTTGKIRLQNPVSQKFADELPADKQPSFESERKQTSAARLNEDFTGAGIRRRLAAGDPKARADYQRLIEESSALAGGKAGATQEADEPTRIKHEIQTDEYKHLYDEPKAKIHYDEMTEMIGRTNPNAPGFVQYKKDQAAASQYRQQLRNDFSNYLKTDAPNFDEYKANRAAYPRQGDKRGMPSGDTRPTTPVDSGASWNEKK